MNSYRNNRRDFLKKIGYSSLAAGTAVSTLNAKQVYELRPSRQEKRTYSANDRIRMAFIGCGIQGINNARSARKINGVEIAAACDLYTGRLTRMNEVFGKDVITTKNYVEILERSDIDAVCISTTDHWHDHMVKAALKAGKAVYCEKPMMHRIEEGISMVAAEKEANLPVQIGSQYASALDTLKAKELFESGAIGQLILAEIIYDRNTSNGAWQYSIPTDANDGTVDWESFIGDAPNRPYDPVRFFRWRNYGEYGTGVAGDLFVHLFTQLHVITSSVGPEKIYATGGLRFWKDGRDAPDITLGLYDYPETAAHPAFNVQMRVNFVDGGGGGSSIKLIGSEGTMTLGWENIVVRKNPVQTALTYGGWDSYGTFSKSQQKDYVEWFKATYPDPKPTMLDPAEEVYTIPRGYSSHVEHWQNFINGVRDSAPIVEDTTFGLRAAGPALATNESMTQNKIIHWNPVDMKLSV